MRDLWKWQTQIKNRSDSCNLQRYIQATVTVTLIYLLNIFTQAVYMNVFNNEHVYMNISNNEAVYMNIFNNEDVY